MIGVVVVVDFVEAFEAWVVLVVGFVEMDVLGAWVLFFQIVYFY